MVSRKAKDEALITLTEVAQYLRVAERTVYQWAQQGRVPSFKIGNVWRFKQSDIDTWIEERKRDTPRTRKVAAEKQ